MVVGEWSLGEKNKNEELGEKNEKGERKREDNYIKTGKKALKFIFLGYKLQQFSRGGGGNDRNAQNVSEFSKVSTAFEVFYTSNVFLYTRSYDPIDAVFSGDTDNMILILIEAQGCNHVNFL